MTDIVTRLRGPVMADFGLSGLGNEAADEIERLKARPADELLLEENKLMRAALLSQSDEIERLTAERDEARRLLMKSKIEKLT